MEAAFRCPKRYFLDASYRYDAQESFPEQLLQTAKLKLTRETPSVHLNSSDIIKTDLYSTQDTLKCLYRNNEAVTTQSSPDSWAVLKKSPRNGLFQSFGIDY